MTKSSKPETKEKMMPRMENNGGDALARGAARYTFQPAGQKLSRDEWEKIFADGAVPEVKGVYLFKCPIHGQFESTREFYLSGGFPELDEKYAKGKCPVEASGETCDEVSEYDGYRITTEVPKATESTPIPGCAELAVTE